MTVRSAFDMAFGDDPDIAAIGRYRCMACRTITDPVVDPQFNPTIDCCETCGEHHWLHVNHDHVDQPREPVPMPEPWKPKK